MTSYTIETGSWREFPQGTASETPLFIIPDVHGNAAVLEALIDGFVGSSSDQTRYTVVFLGDIIDRGPENIRAVELSRHAREVFGGHVILPGNHEIMLLDGMVDAVSLQLWVSNGGYALLGELPDWSSKPSKLREQIREALPDGYIEELSSSRSYFQSGNILCVHGGLCPMTDKDWRRQRDEFLARPMHDMQEHHWAWIRKPFLMWRGGWDPMRRDVVVHGHTVMCREKLSGISAVELVCDHVPQSRRLSLDVGAPFFNQIVGLEVDGGRYRFHFASSDEPLA